MNTKKTQRRSPLAVFVEQRLAQLPANERDITLLAGFTDGRALQMLINEDRFLPLDFVPSLAGALECDSGHLFYLALQQFFEPEILAMMEQTFSGREIVPNEIEWLNVIRRFHEGTVPALTPEREAKLMQALRLVR